ncbi:MAPEG family protein [Hyphobacterium sp. HN65]|uniref:MAPEG family protein n=1 Tax=Hyphobacterium lacteum TaxID=3116575 RepID=A0ABU7LQ93_9PROT|nr:MAPEG family protein [Hyphobacterium sp. HN65]MEE2526084.1 MAPEG family protein [Hyphobacterium sp. HN65]
MDSILTPALALICWTLVMWIWMYATRIPAMQKAKINPAKITSKSDLDVLPKEVTRIADNYNHLHEQPVVFYALVFYAAAAGSDTSLMIMAAWLYVILRIAHSLIQALWNFIPVRFLVFSLSSLVLFLIAGINVGHLFGS